MGWGEGDWWDLRGRDMPKKWLLNWGSAPKNQRNGGGGLERNSELKKLER